MSERIIMQANITAIESGLQNISLLTQHLGQQIQNVQGEQAEIRGRVEAFIQQFSAFVKQDEMQKIVGISETRLVGVRQRLDTEFGHYADVRRRATGILQAVDHGLVGNDVIRHTTEDLMMGAVGYWLAPTLVAIAAWIRDDRPLAERAISEAVRRDDYKTSLCLALLMRRMGRWKGCGTWMERFFQHQQPSALDREFIVLLDAVANGVFGPEGQAATSKRITGWMQELGAQPGFAEAEETRWREALWAIVPDEDGGRYSTLQRYSPTWPALLESLTAVRMHEPIGGYFNQMFAGSIVVPSNVTRSVDTLLDSLVTNFDDEELPLRSEARKLELIIDEQGDKTRADQRFSAEKQAYDEKVSFTGLLTNAAMFPEQARASRATQRFATAMSRDWILAAHNSLTAGARAAVPMDIAVAIDGWSGTTRDGSNTEQLLRDQSAVYNTREAAEIAAVKLSSGAMVAIGLGAAIALMGVFKVSVLFMLVGAAGLIYGFMEYRNLGKRRDVIRAQFITRKKEAADILRAVAANVVDFRREMIVEDQKAAQVTEFLMNISPEQYTLSHAANARAILA